MGRQIGFIGAETNHHPSSDIIEQALDQYQTVLRKPAYTLWVVDYSGSMSGKGKSGAVAGLQAALDTDQHAPRISSGR